MINYPFNNQILESIQRNKAIAVTDTSVDGNLIRGVQLIITKTKDFELEYKLYSKDQKANTGKTAEAATLLDLVETVIKRIEHLTNRIIIIYNDNKKYVE